MIENYNRRQRLLAALAAVLSVVALVGTLLFFFVGSWFALYNLRIENRLWIATGIAIAVTLVAFWAGWRRGEAGKGHYGFHESGLHARLDPVSGGAFMTNLYTNRVTAPTFLLGQLFLAAPLQARKAFHQWCTRIPEEPGLESQLEAFLREIQAKGSWHDLATYDNRMLELGYLVRMERVEISPRKGRIRALPPSQL